MARLQSARIWLKTYKGKSIAAGYRKHFGVDWVCAFRELEMLGVKIDSDYKSRILRSVEGDIAARQRRKARAPEREESPLDHDDYFAYIAGYTEAGFAFGITWEEWERLEHEDLFEPEVDSNNTNFNDDPRDIPF